MSNCNAFVSQAAKEARASEDILVEIFEQVEMFFQRLKIYTELPSTMEIMDVIVRIMVQVLSVLGIATKQVKQGRISKHLLSELENVH